MTGKGLTIFAAALVTLTGCQMQTMGAGSEIEAAICDAWQDSLPTRSRSDTPETIAQIGRAFDMFEAVCQRSVK